ncbi:hypothetical protein ACXM1Q_005440 [Streptococcus sp. 10F2]
MDNLEIVMNLTSLEVYKVIDHSESNTQTEQSDNHQMDLFSDYSLFTPL